MPFFPYFDDFPKYNFKFSLKEIGSNENKSFPLWIINQNVGVIVAARDLREHQNRLNDGMILHLCLLTNI